MSIVGKFAGRLVAYAAAWVMVTVALVGLAGCATSGSVPIDVVGLKDINASMTEINTIIHQLLPVGLRGISSNGREFTSELYVVKNKQYVAAGDASVRYWAKVRVLNSARPFELEFEVHREVREDNDGHIQYVEDGSDLRLAKWLRSQFHDRLAKRREDLNLLDDFRVF